MSTLTMHTRGATQYAILQMAKKPDNLGPSYVPQAGMINGRRTLAPRTPASGAVCKLVRLGQVPLCFLLLGAHCAAIMLIAWFHLLAVSTFAAQTLGQSAEKPPRPAHSIDIHNGTALGEYTASLRQLHVQSGGGRSLPSMSRNTLAGRIRNLFEGSALEARAECTCATCKNTRNYCFPDAPTFGCDNCGPCCVADINYCCGSRTDICCPADHPGDGCCAEWQRCDQTSGCYDPTCVIPEYSSHSE